MLPTRANYVHILVPVKRAIDYAVKVRIAKDGKGVDTSVKHSMVSEWSQGAQRGATRRCLGSGSCDSG